MKTKEIIETKAYQVFVKPGSYELILYKNSKKLVFTGSEEQFILDGITLVWGKTGKMEIKKGEIKTFQINKEVKGLKGILGPGFESVLLLVKGW